MLRICSRTDPDFETRLAALARRTAELPAAVETAAREVIAEVRAGGDAAVRAFTHRFEKRTLRALELSRTEWQAEADRVDPKVRRAIERAAERVRAFHRRELHPGFEMTEEGIRLGLRVTPLERVGLYVPGGTARYPSTVIMTAVPAKVAGVPEVVMVTPGPSPETLAAALVAGVDRVFPIGGAQAIAALAYGTESIPRVDKIVGPGNAYVTAAKRLVYGDVGIDMIAGPTEVVIAADSTAHPALVAADLLAQAEHDPGSAVLITPSASLAAAVVSAVDVQLPALERASAARAALERYSAAVVTDSLDAACDLASEIAAEHLQIITADDARCLARIRHAGAIFLGPHTPVPLGDYFAGPSHVLPTGGTAKFFGPLSVNDFLKASSLIAYDAEAMAEDSAGVQDFANREGLTAHAAAAKVRSRQGG